MNTTLLLLAFLCLCLGLRILLYPPAPPNP